MEAGQDIGSSPMSPTHSTPTPNTPGTPKSPLPCTVTTPTKTTVPDAIKSSPGCVSSPPLSCSNDPFHLNSTRVSCSVLLVSPPSLPQLGSVLPASQSGPAVSQPVNSQHAARIVSHLAAGSLPQVRVVSAQPGLGTPSGSRQAALVHQSPHQIRMPVSVATKSISQVKGEMMRRRRVFLTWTYLHRGCIVSKNRQLCPCP